MTIRYGMLKKLLFHLAFDFSVQHLGSDDLMVLHTSDYYGYDYDYYYGLLLHFVSPDKLSLT